MWTIVTPVNSPQKEGLRACTQSLLWSQIRRENAAPCCRNNAKKRLIHHPPLPTPFLLFFVAFPEYSKHHRLIAPDRYTLVGQDEFLLQRPESQQTLSRCPIRRRAAQEARMQILYCVSRRCRTAARSKTRQGHSVMKGSSHWRRNKNLVWLASAQTLLTLERFVCLWRLRRLLAQMISKVVIITYRGFG